MFHEKYTVKVQLSVRDRIKGFCFITFSKDIEDVAECIIDTGAAMTTIPQHVWEPFVSRKEVDSLDSMQIRGLGGTVDGKVAKVSLALAGAVEDTACDLGLCNVIYAFDGDAAKSDHSNKSPNPRKPMPYVLLGLGGGTLRKGGFCINWKEQSAAYVEHIT